MYKLIGYNTKTEYGRHRYKECLYQLMIERWPTKSSVNERKSAGTTALKYKMPEPMTVIKVEEI
ncbi:hypothetical protein ACPBEI_07315 [Latilactobacillus sakei]